MKRKTILFFYNHTTTFVQKDIRLLQQRYDVITHDFYVAEKWKTPFAFVAQKIFILRYLFSADIFLCQFAGYHSLLPALFAKLFGKKCMVIVGGTDAHNFPGIGYGNFQKKYLKWFTAFTYRFCSHILPKHASLMQCDYTYDANEPSRQGIHANLKNLTTPYIEVPNGYDAAVWQRQHASLKNSFVTICGGWSFHFQKQLKGIDLILQVAERFPDCEFAIAGVPDVSVLGPVPSNVKVLSPVPNAELPQLFSSYNFYLQLSMAEGFPNALCEAMLCECVPVGSAVFSIPDIISDTGFVLKHRSVDELEQLLNRALASNTALLGKRARQRIADHYTEKQRQQKLFDVIDSAD